MKFKGTKGNWEASSIELADFEDHIVACGNEIICHLYNNGNQKANALLISKAPEMLEMLESILQLQKENYGSGINTHLALITKAEEIEKLIKEATELKHGK